MKKNLKGSLDDIKHVHFIGIGGIGISALAKMMLHIGKKVSGTNDQESHETLDELRKKGVKINIGTTEDLVPEDVDLFVYSVAWESRGPKVLKEARRRGVPVLNYFEALGEATKKYKTIAVSGTHGKTTTTAMIYKVLENQKKTPNLIVGSLLSQQGSNYVSGNSGDFVVEACEYKRHFLNLSPTIAVITNIEEDHLDYYKDLKDIQNAFWTFAKSIPKDGVLICNNDNDNVKPILKNLVCKVIDYNKYLINQNIKLKVPGQHNIENAKAAMAVANFLDIDLNKAKISLEQFSGTWRRFEFKGETKKGVKVYNDYAHHPSEIKAVLESAKSLIKKDGKIFVIFEPHMFSRTKALMSDFAKSFKNANYVYITPIYPAREKPIKGIDNKKLAYNILKYNKNTKAGSIKEAVREIKNIASDDDIILLLGAGDIYQSADEFVK